jgi:hypothetical protein
LDGERKAAIVRFLYEAELLDQPDLGIPLVGRLLAHDLDLDGVITDLPPDKRKEFLRLHKTFLDSLSKRELANFKLSSEKLARFRREASGP